MQGLITSYLCRLGRHVPTKRNVTTFDGLRFWSLFSVLGWILLIKKCIYSCLTLLEFTPTVKKSYRNLSPSKVARYIFYVGTCLWKFLCALIKKVRPSQWTKSTFFKSVEISIHWRVMAAFIVTYQLHIMYIILMNRAISKLFFRIVNNPQPWFSPREKVIRVLYEQTRLCGVDSTKLKKKFTKSLEEKYSNNNALNI